MVQIDPTLVYRAGKVTDGGNVHKINNLLGTYFAAVEVCRIRPTEQLKKQIEQIEKDLINIIHKTEFIRRKEQYPSFEVPIKFS